MANFIILGVVGHILCVSAPLPLIAKASIDNSEQAGITVF